MHIVFIAWFYVALMAAISEAVSPSGTILGAIITFVLYGLLPIGIVGYISGTGSRRKARQRAQAQETKVQEAQGQTTQAPSSTLTPNASSHAPRDAIASERKEL